MGKLPVIMLFNQLTVFVKRTVLIYMHIYISGNLNW